MKVRKILTLNNQIHLFRAGKRITQQELAEAIGVTRATINAIEQGDYNPSLELAFRLARYFNTDLHSLFSAEEASHEQN